MVGTLIEEVISPIPAFVVLVPAGIAVQARGEELWYLLLLAVLSGVGRVIGATILYWLADKSEGILFKGKRTFFGVSHKDVLHYGKQLSGKRNTKVWATLFFMHAIPVFPGAMITLASGFLKIRFDTFITATFLGSIIGAIFFLYIGYAGLQTAKLIPNFEATTNIALVVCGISILAWLVYRYIKSRRIPRTRKK